MSIGALKVAAARRLLERMGIPGTASLIGQHWPRRAAVFSLISMEGDSIFDKLEVTLDRKQTISRPCAFLSPLLDYLLRWRRWYILLAWHDEDWWWLDGWRKPPKQRLTRSIDRPEAERKRRLGERDFFLHPIDLQCRSTCRCTRHK